MSLPTDWAHVAALASLLAAYVVLTISGHDATVLIGVLGGYVGGAGVQKVTAAKAA